MNGSVQRFVTKVTHIDINGNMCFWNKEKLLTWQRIFRNHKILASEKLRYIKWNMFVIQCIGILKRMGWTNTYN